MKIYTRTGDAGTTALADGSRRSKADSRLEAYGTIDELNSSLGLVKALAEPGKFPVGDDEWATIQSILFDIGAALATPGATVPPTGRPSAADITAMEKLIDRLEEGLPKLRSFILPAGCAAACQAHVARTVCRRAERRMVALEAELKEACEPMPARELMAWVNRLSDMLFTLARALNAAASIAETPWLP